MTDFSNLHAGWLGDLPGEMADRVVSIGRWTEVDRGEIVYRHGDDNSELFGIASGTARIQIAINEHEQRVAHIMGPGFWFGGNAFVSGTPRAIEVEAATELLLLQIRPQDFQNLTHEVPEAWKWIAHMIAQHLLLSMGAVDDLMLSSSEKRLAAVLLRFSGHRLNHPNSPPVNSIPTTQQELATAANLSRASAGRILREMEKRGEISIEYGAVVIRDAPALAARLA